MTIYFASHVYHTLLKVLLNCTYTMHHMGMLPWSQYSCNFAMVYQACSWNFGTKDDTIPKWCVLHAHVIMVDVVLQCWKGGPCSLIGTLLGGVMQCQCGGPCMSKNFCQHCTEMVLKCQYSVLNRLTLLLQQHYNTHLYWITCHPCCI